MGRNVKRRLRRALQNQGGFTIVSVMAAFVILLLGIGMLYTAVRSSANMISRARTLDAAAGETLEAYYLSETETEGGQLILREVGGTEEIEVSLP